MTPLSLAGRALTLAGALALCLPSPAQAAVDEPLRLEQTERPVLIEHDIRHRGRHYGYREQIITTGRLVDLFVAKGARRLSEGQFLELLGRSGAAPELLQRIARRQADASWHGGIAAGSWIGALAAGAIAELEFGPGYGLLQPTGPNQVAVNTAGIAAVAFAVVGTVYTLFWLSDTGAKGAPYFHAFSVNEAEQAIADYNRRVASQHPTPLNRSL